MDFITVNGKVRFVQGKLIFIKVKNDETKSQSVVYVTFILLFIALQLYRAIYEKPRAWVMVLIGFVWLYSFLEKFYKSLFVFKWGNEIIINQVKEIDVLPIENNLETKVRLRFNDNRIKILVFRTNENQVDAFIGFIKKESNQFSNATTNQVDTSLLPS
jgi:hypothetical protein